jgi:hypothetical protein
MGTLFTAFLIFGILATLLFAAGYARGARIALRSYADDRIEVDDSGDIKHFWVSAAFAVVAATLVIALAGIVPAFIYVGPALCILTAAANGLAFFLEDAPSP